MFNCFEHPWGLITIAIITSLVLMMFRSIFPGKRRWWQWLLPVFLVVAAFGLDFLVETDLEKINAVINKGVKAVEDENPDAIEMIIADNYTDSYHSSKSVLMAHCREILSEPLIEKNIKRTVSIDIQPPKATAIFTVRILFDKRSYVYQSFKSQMMTEVQADLQKQPDNLRLGTPYGGWLINRVELLKIDFQPAGWQYTERANQ
jgi:hypothetical protein